MSRSRRKTPIFGIAQACSEKQDKAIWHRRLRAAERTILASAAPAELDGHIGTHMREVSNPWTMAKDGRRYWPTTRQRASAERSATRCGQSPAERQLLQQRMLHKIMGK
ncbi:hypothetical protein [Xenophilus azovorans]|uniref:hypothetical protein n=1 Tax=Xenophilus azovorans TaxID=151755 RepID=UPI00056F6245|nr:hypothetical protein [Xenophilus azovorans]